MPSEAEELYFKLWPDGCKEDIRGYFYAPSDYQPIINSFGKPLIQVDDKDYQGDTRVLYEDQGKGFGYLQFGWGSCSGCDALQACHSYEDVAKLVKELEASVKWLPEDEMLSFFETHDWEGDYSYYDERQKLFIDKVIAYLKGGESAKRG